MKYLYIILGSICALLGIVGIVIPVLPTTPFILMALFFYSRSSKKVENWFKSTKLYKNYAEDFIKRREMTLRNKVIILSFASCMLLLSFYIVDILLVRIFIIFLIFYKYYYFITKIKTIDSIKVKL